MDRIAGLKQFWKYVAVQVLAYGVEWSAFLALNEISPSLFASNLLAKICALTFAFILHRVFTFEARTGSSVRQITRYFALGGVLSLSSSGVLVLFSTLMDEYVAKLLSDFILIVISFLVSKLLIFKNE